jgi:hypothetical protein
MGGQAGVTAIQRTERTQTEDGSCAPPVAASRYSDLKPIGHSASAAWNVGSVGPRSTIRLPSSTTVSALSILKGSFVLPRRAARQRRTVRRPRRARPPLATLAREKARARAIREPGDEGAGARGGTAGGRRWRRRRPRCARWRG